MAAETRSRQSAEERTEGAGGRVPDPLVTGERMERGSVECAACSPEETCGAAGSRRSAAPVGSAVRIAAVEGIEARGGEDTETRETARRTGKTRSEVAWAFLIMGGPTQSIGLNVESLLQTGPAQGAIKPSLAECAVATSNGLP